VERASGDAKTLFQFVVIWEIDRGNNTWICMYSLKQGPPIPFFCTYSLLPIIAIILLLLPLSLSAYRCFVHAFFCHCFFCSTSFFLCLLCFCGTHTTLCVCVCSWENRNIAFCPFSLPLSWPHPLLLNVPSAMMSKTLIRGGMCVAPFSTY